MHASCLGNISLAREDCGFHAGHVFAISTDGLPGEVAIVDDALPRVIALSVFFNERIVLFFFDLVIDATRLDLFVALLLPLVEVALGLGLASFLILVLLLLLLIQILFPRLRLFFYLLHELQLLPREVVILLLARWHMHHLWLRHETLRLVCTK